MQMTFLAKLINLASTPRRSQYLSDLPQKSGVAWCGGHQMVRFGLPTHANDELSEPNQTGYYTVAVIFHTHYYTPFKLHCLSTILTNLNLTHPFYILRQDGTEEG